MMSTSDDLSGRVVVITGAAVGIGRACVDAFLAAGSKVVATDISWSGIPLPAGEAAERLLTIEMDVAKAAEIDKAYMAAVDRFGTVDALINCPPRLHVEPIPATGGVVPATLQIKDADWERFFAGGVFDMLKQTRRFIQPMVNKKRGSIVNLVSSGILSHEHRHLSPSLPQGSREVLHQSSKAALTTISFYLAEEIKARNVAVNIVVLGPAHATDFDSQTPTGSDLGTPPVPLPALTEHILSLVMHLALQDASGMTGRFFDPAPQNVGHAPRSPISAGGEAFSYGLPIPH
jgi:NAD(P)-dependent dehydrogenase (short-subunit alcohol dehydrogenase family)